MESYIHPHDLLRQAAALYTVTESGDVVSARGKTLNLVMMGRYHAVAAPKIGGKSRKIYVHRLVAYSKFGEAIFEPGIEVRHKDNDRFNNRPANILIGTGQENSLDIPLEERVRRTQHAVAAKNAAMTPEERTYAASHASKSRSESMEPEERKASAHKASDVFQGQMEALTAEERRDHMSKAIAASSKYSHAFRAEVVAKYQAGDGFLRVGKHFGLSAQTVRDWVRKAGVPIRKYSDVEHRHQSALRGGPQGEKPQVSKNRHGLPGVSRTKSGLWTSRAKINGVFRRTGIWPTKEAAHLAYLALKVH